MGRQLGPVPASAQSAKGVLLGRDPNTGRLLRYSGDAHMVTLAMTGAGKFTNSFGPNLAAYPGSVFCVDPKGQCAAVAARARRSAPINQPVHILNPFAVYSSLLGPTASYNIFDWLVKDRLMLVDHAIMVADALVVQEDGSEKEGHFNEQAKTLIQGLIVHVATSPVFEGKRNLITMRKLLQRDIDGLKELLLDMAGNEAAGGAAADVGNSLMGTPPNERGSIISTANRHLRFIASEGVQTVIERSSFDLAALKEKPMTVFVFLPAKFLESHQRWLRMIVTVALLAATKEEVKKPEHPVLWMLDELAQMGRLDAVSKGYRLLRGFGYRIWGVFQDLPAMQEVYGEKAADSMLSQSVVQGFNLQCDKTAQWFATQAGKQMTGGYSTEGPTLKEVLRSDEARFLDRDTQLIRIPNERVFTCKKLVSWKDPEFAPVLDPDPTQ